MLMIAFAVESMGGTVVGAGSVAPPSRGAKVPQQGPAPQPQLRRALIDSFERRPAVPEDGGVKRPAPNCRRRARCPREVENPRSFCLRGERRGITISVNALATS